MASTDFENPLLTKEGKAEFREEFRRQLAGLKLLWGEKWCSTSGHWTRGARIPGRPNECIAVIHGDANGLWVGDKIQRETWEEAAADAERRLFARSWAVVEFFTAPGGE